MQLRRGMGTTSVVPQAADPYQAKNSFFFNTSIAAALAPAASTTSTFTLTADADFIWTKLSAYAQSASDGTTVSAQQLPGVTIVIVNTSTGRQFSNTGIPIANMAGTQGLPFIMPQQTLWQANSTITVTYQNITDNITYSELHLTFAGIKCFLRATGG